LARLSSEDQKVISFSFWHIFHQFFLPPTVDMSRNRSMKTKKQRNGRRSAKKAASESAKPASRPTPSPEAPRQSSPTGILLRKVPHITRNLKARVRKLENKLDRYERCEKQLLEQLTAARDQIHQLNAAMYYVLHQPPHTGDYKDAV
jgi:hypothetical protein